MVLGITIGILILLVILVYLSRKEEGNLLARMSFYMFKVCCLWQLPIVEKVQVRADLERLYPGASKREVQMEYYINKFRLSYGTNGRLFFDTNTLLEDCHGNRSSHRFFR